MWNISASSIWYVSFPVPVKEKILSRSPALLSLCCACSSCSSSHHQQEFVCLLLEKTKTSTKLQQSALCCGWWPGDGDRHSLCCCRPCWNLCIYWSWIVQYCHHLAVRVVFPGALELTFCFFIFYKTCHHSRENLPCVSTIKAEVKTKLKQTEVIGFLSQPFFISFLFLQWRKINRFLPWNSSVW